MRKDKLKQFKRLFEAQKRNILFNDRVIREDFSVSNDDRYDELDQATSDSEQYMRMRLRNREILYIKKIDEALKRIEEGVFGECDECGEPIEVRRLEARPTATLCVGCKEDAERKEVLTAAGHQHKSLGETFTRKLS
ncbi:MAG TPA: conjugal transfer protein TraR [Bdellovibrionales bacterium]|nr:MAG: hypothetical protein A2Z97_02625 [Bdellovibrionales bacterium GWB1_52_6]OFZ03484.1 MAG: hypothetical protein A2X97_05930 [Bdellovibrionales bacterium GWA1_52_35]OFZ37470.1 MAG: hypothetical protein A2070_13085 [Bdellovibrionales bacterium GWC1_52_8]HAR44128.1 conjugal transfer protein TraR [Bdellovibrionales bacterium]HCM41068.1 conjugal transfer protein TraR [Bdellovibrionales bacterium]